MKLFTITAATLTLICLSSCKHDMDDYVKQHYSVTDQERVAYAEKILGVTIDMENDWVLTTKQSVKIVADAPLEHISTVAVLDANPYADENFLLAARAVDNGQEATLAFRMPKSTDMLYAACITADGECIARPFTPGVDKTVSFRDQEQEASSRTLPRTSHLVPRTSNLSSPHSKHAPFVVDHVIDNPTYKNFYVKDFYSFRKAVKKALPKGADNRNVIGKDLDFNNTISVFKNPYTTYDLALVYIGGDSDKEYDIFYSWYPEGVSEERFDFLIKDNYPAGWKDPDYDTATRQYKLTGHQLKALQNGEVSDLFTSGDILSLKLAKGQQEISDDGETHVKVFRLNNYVFVACEAGNDWDYNDRIFWMPNGTERIEAGKLPVDPEPSKPQVYTYAWEDKDFGDYDLNDCVIEACINATDTTKLDITLVALGATQELWLGFDTPNATSYRDYKFVFDRELHQVLGVSTTTIVNTGLATATPVTITVDKPKAFDFQTCSFVLGAKVDPEIQGVYDNDFYYIKIATAGQDPHGIVIPGKWKWPTERTCIKDAYPDFKIWAYNRTKALNWYLHPVSGKVIK